MDALVGADGDAELRGAGAVVAGLGDDALPGDGPAGDGEDDEAGVAEPLAGVAVGRVAGRGEEGVAGGARWQGVVGEVEVFRGDDVEGDSQEEAEGEVREGGLAEEARDDAVGEVGVGASGGDDEADGAGDALGKR